jgi:hypothetical protein
MVPHRFCASENDFERKLYWLLLYVAIDYDKVGTGFVLAGISLQEAGRLVIDPEQVLAAR